MTVRLSQAIAIIYEFFFSKNLRFTAEVTEEESDHPPVVGSREESLLVIRTRDEITASKGRIEEKEEIVMSPTGTPDESPPTFNTTHYAHPVLKRSGRVLSSSNKGESLKTLNFLEQKSDDDDSLPSTVEESDNDSNKASTKESLLSSPEEPMRGINEGDTTATLENEIADAMLDDCAVKTSEKEGSSDIGSACQEISESDSALHRSIHKTVKYADTEQEEETDKARKMNTHNLVRLSSTGSAARLKVKNFVESMIGRNERDGDDDLPDMNQVCCC